MENYFFQLHTNNSYTYAQLLYSYNYNHILTTFNHYIWAIIILMNSTGLFLYLIAIHMLKLVSKFQKSSRLKI